MNKYTTGDLCDTLNQLNYDNWFDAEDAPDFLQEVKCAAWNIVKENPSIDRDEWIDALIEQYPAEVVDAFGVDSAEVYRKLSDLWETEYTDPETGEWNSFAGWSRCVR